MNRTLNTKYAVAFICVIASFLICISPAGASPVVGPEALVGTSFRNALGNQDGVEISGGLNGCLAVWQDTRGGNSDIFGCRIDNQGQAMDPFGIAISTAKVSQTDPAVSWNGQMYLVVWSDTRGSLQHIYGARVMANGQVIEKQGILLSGTVGAQTCPKVASDGRGWIVVWQDARGSSNDIYGCKVNADGSFSRVYGICTRADNEEAPDVAWNGSYFLVAWRDYRNSAASDIDIYGCRVARNCIRTGADILISCDATGTSGAPEAQSEQRVCALGSTWMVVWKDHRDAVHNRIYGTRVSSSGTVMDRNGIAITSTGDQETPNVSYDGKNIVVVFRNRSDRYAMAVRLDTAGYMVDESMLSISSGIVGSGGIGVCGYGNKFAVAWNTLSISDSDIMYAQVSDSGAIQGSAAVISTSSASQQDYCVADDGTNYAVVWAQLIDGQWDIMAAKVSHSGEMITQTSINLTSLYPGDQTQPSIAWNGSHYLVVWRGNETRNLTDWDIRGIFLDANLNTLSTTYSPICEVDLEQSHPCVTSNGSSFLVVWEDYRFAVSPDYNNDIFGAVVSAAGAVTPVAAGISTAVGNQFSPKAASDGSGFLVVWEDNLLGTLTACAARVGSAGQLLDTVPLRMPATSQYQTQPDVCFGGGSYLVTWSDYTMISACRVSPSGGLLDKTGIIIDSGIAQRSRPSAWWDSSKYNVVWEDYRSTFIGNSDIYYSCISSDGQVSADPRIALVSDMYPQLRPHIFSNGTSGILTYTKLLNYSNCVAVVKLTEQGVQKMKTISEAKDAPSGTQVAISDKVVSAVYTDYFYIEELDRSSGIKVVSSTPVTVGSIVDITGIVSLVDGERQLFAGSVSTMGAVNEPLRPFAMRGDFLGGAALNASTPGITGAVGCYNIGLLVTTWGKVISKDVSFFYIQPCVGVSIRVNASLPAPGVVGSLVSVTGISSCEVLEGSLGRAIIPRQTGDIRILK